MHPDRSIRDNKEFGLVLDAYYNDRMKFYPVEATQNGDYRFNDQLPISFTDSYLDTLRNFYAGYLDQVLVFNRDKLNQNDQISYDIIVRQLKLDMEGIDLHLVVDNVTQPNVQYMPFTQFEGIPIFLGEMGSGTGIQPFKTVQDYNNWITRASKFQSWSDSAIVYFRKGLTNGYILPRCLVEKMIPEMRSMAVTDTAVNVFYGPLKNMPASFSNEDKAMLSARFTELITKSLAPAYQKLADFLQNEYLPKSRSSIGYDDLPNGNKLYNYLIRYWTTTERSGEEINQTGLSEVKRIRALMEQLKTQTAFPGDLPSFFIYAKTDPRFRPYNPLHDLVDHRLGIVRRRHEHPRDDFPGAQEGRHGCLHQARCEGAHHHDDERRRTDQRAGTAALQNGAADDRDQGKHDADYTENIHGISPASATPTVWIAIEPVPGRGFDTPATRIRRALRRFHAGSCLHRSKATTRAFSRSGSALMAPARASRKPASSM